VTHPAGAHTAVLDDDWHEMTTFGPQGAMKNATPTDAGVKPIDAIPTVLACALVKGLLNLTEEALCAVCKTDAIAREELIGFPDGFTFEMTVLPSGPGLRLRKQGSEFQPDRATARPTLSIQFKHIRHALRVIGMVDDIPLAIANDRLVIDGELSWAMRVGRITERMMSALVPRSFVSAPASVRLYAAMARR
jgi:hypothetical protein